MSAELAAWRGEVAIALVLLAAVAFALGGAWLRRAPALQQRPVRARGTSTEPAPWWLAAGSDAAADLRGDRARDVDARIALIDALAQQGNDAACRTFAAAWRTDGDLAVREAALGALQWCDGQEPPAVFHEALALGSESERVLAIEGLARRGRHDAIVPALDDASDDVALAAALALARGGRGELVEAARRRRGARFAETLDLLEA